MEVADVTICDCDDYFGNYIGQVVSTDGDLSDQCNQMSGNTDGAVPGQGSGSLQNCQVSYGN